MLLTEIKKIFTKWEINTSTIQFMVNSERFDNRPYVYCCNVGHLLNDWWGDCNIVPENDAVLLMATLYQQGIAYPIVQVGLDDNITFEALMRALDE